MELEAEPYTNGVAPGSSARVINGTYKHQEILQPDDGSVGNGVPGESDVLRCCESGPPPSDPCVRVCVCVSPADEAFRSSRQLFGRNQAATERMILFGRELQALNEQLCREYGKNTTHKKMLQVQTPLSSAAAPPPLEPSLSVDLSPEVASSR